MGSKHWTAVAGTAVVILLAAVPLASAHGPMPGTEQVEVTLPADGEAVATRAPMPASSTTGTVTVTDTSDDPEFIQALVETLSAAPTRGARVVTCVLMYSALSGYTESPIDFTITEPSLQLLFLYSCVRMALLMGQQQNGAAHLGGAMAHESAAGCKPLPVGAPIHITKTASGYTATVNGTPSKPKRLTFRVSCRRTTTSLRTTVRPTSAKAKLSKTIGPILGVGFGSTSSSSGKLKIALGVR